MERFLVFKSTESFRIEIDNRRLEWGAYAISGRVLKRLAGVPESYGVWLETDLREGKVERFLVFKSTESFRIEIDNRRLEWGAYAISGRVLKRLAGVPESYGVWLEMRGEQDRPIDNNELVSLEGKGLERFFTGPDQTTEGNS